MPVTTSRAIRAAAVVAAIFGLATIVSGGRVLFGPESARAAAGRVVPVVVQFNFAAGFAYVAAGAGLLRGQRWGAILSVAIAAATAIVLAGLGVYAIRGGAHEPRTVVAMLLRTTLWTTIAAVSCRKLGCLRTDAARR